MIWKSRLFLKDRLGETRTVEKFLWYPRMFSKHWYWLIKAKLEQTIVEMDVGGSMEWSKYSYQWCTTGIFINNILIKKY
jgi:hypothetical protein